MIKNDCLYNKNKHVAAYLKYMTTRGVNTTIIINAHINVGYYLYYIMCNLLQVL